MTGCSIPLKSSRVTQSGEQTLRPPAALVQSLRARAVIRLSGNKEREFTGKAVVLVKGPDKVRLEIFDLFGQMAAVIVSDGHALSVFSNNNSKFFTRDEKRPLIFQAPELANFLMGVEAASEEFHAGRTALDYSQGGLYSRKILFEDFRDLEGALFPFSLSVEDGRERFSVSYSSIELNPELDDSLFNHIAPGSNR